jgi:hypothetical protein
MSGNIAAHNKTSILYHIRSGIAKKNGKDTKKVYKVWTVQRGYGVCQREVFNFLLEPTSINGGLRDRAAATLSCFFVQKGENSREKHRRTPANLIK